MDISDRLRAVYSLDSVITGAVKNHATEVMLEAKFNNINQLFDEKEADKNNRNRIVSELIYDEDRIDVLETQVPHWELIVGLSLICGLTC